MKTKKQARPAARKATASSKALVPVKRQLPSRRRERPVRQELVLSNEAAALLAGPPAKLPQDLVQAQTHLTDEIEIGNLGVEEVKLTPEEEKVLSEPVNEDDVLVKPTGQLYLSHPTYTRWFNRAFGRTGWALVPASLPKRSENTVVQPYVLFIHGKRVAFANGEQVYHENNDEQTWGDALESTVAFALRRCAKRLGVGLELWDKPWIQQFIERHVVQVWREGRNKPSYRRRTDPPFYDEKGITNRRSGEVEEHEARRRNSASSSRPPQRQASSRPEPPPAHHDGTGDQVITEPQRSRLWTIASNAHRTNSEVKDWLARSFGYDSSKDIKRKDYERICAAIEHPGPLGGEREPGQEG